MIEYELGQVVRSAAGRDQGNLFVIIDIEDPYVMLVDGKTRRLEQPKKKKMKHIQITHDIIEALGEKLTNGDKISNAEIRKSLKNYEQKADEPN